MVDTEVLNSWLEVKRQCKGLGVSKKSLVGGLKRFNTPGAANSS